MPQLNVVNRIVKLAILARVRFIIIRINLIMNQLLTACKAAADFPVRDTVIEKYIFDHQLHGHFGKLNERDKGLFRLFCASEADSLLWFLELDTINTG